MKHLINWVEIPVTEMQRAKSFYSKILGVELNTMEMGDTGYAFFPTEDKFNCGALVQGQYYKPSSEGIVIYLDGGDDLNNVLLKVNEAGGQVILEKMFLSAEAGHIGMFIDSEGNKIGLQNM
jgi:predicted enzyme related to lactoylglutathione lyase